MQPGTTSRRAVVAETLRTKGSDFESFVRARVHPDEVDDIVQVAALRAIERADTLDDPDRVEAWLYRIHRNLIIDRARQRASERRHVDPAAEVPELLDDVDDASCGCSVSQAKRLRPSYASILALVDSDGLRLSEAAKALEVSTNNAAVRLHRARKALREAMLAHCGVSDPRDCATCRCVDDVCCAA